MNFIALYDQQQQAQQAADDLVKAGCSRDKIQVVRQEAAAGNQIAQQLRSWGFDDQETRICVEAVHHGRTLLCAQVADDFAEKARSMMRQHGSRQLNDLARELGIDQQQGQQQGQQGRRHEQTERLQVAEEELSIGKREVSGGGARVTTSVSERPVEQTVQLRQEHVDVERRPTDRTLSPEEAKTAFQERSQEFTATREEAVAQKQAKVKEEIEVKKTTEEQQQKIQDTVRKTDVHIEPVKPGQR